MNDVEDIGRTPEEWEELASAIESVSEAADKAEKAGLSRRALVLLIHDSMPQDTRPGKRQISDVLDVLPELADRYLSPVD